jgi:hypothetical protein
VLDDCFGASSPIRRVVSHRLQSAETSRSPAMGRTSQTDRGCVKTCTSEERAALFSLLSLPIAAVSVFIFQNDEIEKNFLRAV